MIRTLDPHVPNVVRYQTALHSVTSGASIEQAFRFDKRKISKKFALLGKVPEGREIFVPGMWMVGTGARFLRLRAMEREYRDHAAGLRTHILVALAACVFAILSIESVHMAGFSDDQVRIDPLRVIEAVTSGVAFLAAGMIVFSRGEVRGLTTGAGMWLAGAVGLSVGLGYWFVAVVATVACFVVLFILAKIEIGSDVQDEPTRNKET